MIPEIFIVNIKNGNLLYTKMELKCFKCGSLEIYPSMGLVTIFRCSKCNAVGNIKDFGGTEASEEIFNGEI